MGEVYPVQNRRPVFSDGLLGMAGQQGMGDADGELAASVRFLVAPGLLMEAESPHFFQDHIQSLALNKLHGIIMNALVLADSEDRNNVGMVQASGRSRLATKALQICWF